MGTCAATTATPPGEKAVRARRVFCSNRNARPGCGRTISVWLADKIRRTGTSTRRLWSLLRRAVADGIADATRHVGGRLSARTWQRLWRRFLLGQSRIRTFLLGRHPPPESASASRHAPVAQFLAHLDAAFPDPDPLAAFQHAMRSFIIA